jgi:endonuclease YncB( thermonuclease family)
MNVLALVLLILTLAGNAPDPPSRFDANPPRPATLVHVFDGDTICVDLHRSLATRAGRVYHDTRTEDVRIRGFDAPERWEPRGPDATKALTYLLSLGTVWVEWDGRTSFGRLVGDVSVVTPTGYAIDAAGAMRMLGHVK